MPKELTLNNISFNAIRVLGLHRLIGEEDMQ